MTEYNVLFIVIQQRNASNVLTFQSRLTSRNILKQIKSNEEFDFPSLVFALNLSRCKIKQTIDRYRKMLLFFSHKFSFKS